MRRAGTRCVAAVREFADGVLRYGRDVYGSTRTPLLVDGLNVDTFEPATWLKDGETWVLSNLASQQHFFRTLDGLTALTGEAAYREVAETATRYGFEHLQDPNGMLYWGGHVAYDLAGDRLVEERHNQELKAHYPYYELMWRVDPAATKRSLEASWEGHILDWSNLDMNRHGRYDVAFGRAWQHEYAGGPVFFEGKGLTFCNTGSDLIYAGGMLHHFTGEPEPLAWARRMAHRYVETRNPDTGLGGYQYSRFDRGDRALRQFGPEFGERAIEGTVLDRSRARMRYAVMGIALMQLAETMGAAGADFLRWAQEDLAAYSRHAYDPRTNAVRPLLSNGTPLGPDDLKRPGYYSSPPGILSPGAADDTFFWAYALAYRLTRRTEHWETARHMARGLGLGELGEQGDEAARSGSAAVNRATPAGAPHALLGVLELHRATGRDAFLELAARVAENLISQRFHHGYFVSGPDNLFARVGTGAPVALLRFAAAALGRQDAVPTPRPGEPYFQAPYDGLGRSVDTGVIYARTRTGAGDAVRHSLLSNE